MEAPSLFITGCPRSGTSMTAHIFRACGLWAGNTTTQCENRPIREGILKPMLERAGMDKLALRSFADLAPEGHELQEAAQRLRQDVRRELRRQNWDGSPWLYKDAKLVFAWRVWFAAFPEATWVTVWRDRAAIIESFGRWHLGKNLEFDGAQVVDEHHERARDISGAVWLYPDNFLKGHRAEFRHVASLMGVEWDPDAVDEVVHPERYHLASGQA